MGTGRRRNKSSPDRLGQLRLHSNQALGEGPKRNSLCQIVRAFAGLSAITGERDTTPVRVTVVNSRRQEEKDGTLLKIDGKERL